MKLLRLSLFLMSGFLFYACAKKPVFIKVDAVRIISLKDSIFDVEINFMVFNPNGFKSTVTSSKINTFYREMMVGTSILATKLPLPGNDTVVIPMMSKVNIRSLAKVFPELLATEPATFRIEGENKIKSFGISWTVSVKDEIRLNVRDIVVQEVNKTFQNDSNFAIKEIRLDHLTSLNKTSFKMAVEIKNRFPFDYSLTQLHLNVFRKNGTVPIANWDLKGTINQKAGAVSLIPLKIEIDNSNLLKEAGLSNIFGLKMDLLLTGEAKVQIQGYVFSVPIEETGRIVFKPLSGLTFER